MLRAFEAQRGQTLILALSACYVILVLPIISLSTPFCHKGEKRLCDGNIIVCIQALMMGCWYFSLLCSVSKITPLDQRGKIINCTHMSTNQFCSMKNRRLVVRYGFHILCNYFLKSNLTKQFLVKTMWIFLHKTSDIKKFNQKRLQGYSAPNCATSNLITFNWSK